MLHRVVSTNDKKWILQNNVKVCELLLAVLIVEVFISYYYFSLKFVCSVYFLMDALASVKLDNKFPLTKKLTQQSKGPLQGNSMAAISKMSTERKMST